MADTKVSLFGDIPALDLTNDRVPIIDDSATGNAKNKLISPTTLMASKLDLTGGTLTGQLKLQAASATGALCVEPTWNSVGTAFNAIYARVTNTASAAGSCLIDVGLTSSLFKVDKDGVTTCAVALDTDIFRSRSAAWDMRTGRLGLVSSYVIRWTNSTSNAGLENDIGISRDAANAIAFKNGSNACKARVYGDATKYVQFEHDGTNAKLTSSSGGLCLGSSGGTMGLYGVTPVARATTSIAEAAFLTGSGATNLNEDSTFGGYTVAQMAQALIDFGVLS